MRTRATNFLQITVLITGILYIILGIGFFFSPLSILKVFAQNIAESWLDLVRDNELVAPLYFLTRTFSALMFTSGVAMVMPLFDPLKYRGLVFYNGLIFPFIASIFLIKNAIIQILLTKAPGNESAGQLKSLVSGYHGHLVLVIVGVLFSIVFMLSAIALLVTRKQAREGIE